MNNVFFSKKHQGYVMENTLDEYIFGEIRSAYKDLEIKEGDVVLDFSVSTFGLLKSAIIFSASFVLSSLDERLILDLISSIIFSSYKEPFKL